MAPVLLTKTTAPGAYASAGVAVTMAAADAGLGNYFVAGGKDLLIARNSGAGDRHVTVTSGVDEFNRTGTITSETIAAGAVRVFGPFPAEGWVQAGTRNVLVTADNAEVFLGVVSLP
jgi:hypothetical protein